VVDRFEKESLTKVVENAAIAINLHEQLLDIVRQ
jgi:hypothetical protein